eukprot:TRINITY_DN6564_c0_g1_i2.p1 TRINITY_DN6564_c0_g1~~TRINITY_DN6564_c0_g1_i2.p1  ORF type:complete len:404 (-),score=27.45 TRINITY_DN6564_c0_g1_i2:676-1731(-)
MNSDLEHEAFRCSKECLAMNSDSTGFEDDPHEMDSDSSDSDVEVDGILDGHVALIKAPDGQKPVRRRPWGRALAPLDANFEQLESELQLLAEEAHAKTGEGRITKMKFSSAPPSPACREHSQRVSVTAEVEVKEGDCVSVSECKSVQNKMDARRFISASCKINSENRPLLPPLRPETLTTSRVVRKCLHSCSDASRNDAIKNVATSSLRQLNVCQGCDNRPPRHVGRSCSPCPVYSQKADTKGSGMHYNIVRFNATPTLSTSRDSAKPSSSSRSRSKQQEDDKAPPALGVFDEQTITQLVRDSFRGLSRREVREVLHDSFSSDDIACVLEVLSPRALHSNKQRRIRRRGNS